MINDEALKYLNWYFYSDDGMTDKAAVKYYEELKEHLERLEQYVDKFFKIDIYLLRKYQDDLLKEFKCKDEFDKIKTILYLFDKISEEMNKEMPEPWYTYGIGGEEESV